MRKTATWKRSRAFNYSSDNVTPFDEWRNVLVRESRFLEIDREFTSRPRPPPPKLGAAVRSGTGTRSAAIFSSGPLPPEAVSAAHPANAECTSLNFNLYPSTPHRRACPNFPRSPGSLPRMLLFWKSSGGPTKSPHLIYFSRDSNLHAFSKKKLQRNFSEWLDQSQLIHPPSPIGHLNLTASSINLTPPGEGL